MKSLTPSPKVQLFDSNGEFLSGGKVYTYESGTVNPLATYTDYGGLTPNTNPVILDSRGQASIWLGQDPYTFAVYDSLDVLQPDGGDHIIAHDIAKNVFYDDSLVPITADNVQDAINLVSENVFAPIKDIISLINIASPTDDQTHAVLSFFDGLNQGGDDFYWDSTRDKATANGGTIIDPDNIGGFDGTISTLSAYLAAQGTGIGSGCWIRQLTNLSLLDVDFFGAVPDTDSTLAIQKAIDSITSGIITCSPGIAYKVSEQWSYVANGVTINVALRMKQGVELDFNGSTLVYTGTAADTVSNQFYVMSNDTDDATFVGYKARNIHFLNDGVVGVYVSGITVFGGSSDKDAGWLSDVDIHDISGDSTRALIHFIHDRSDGLLPIHRVNVHDISAKDQQSVVINLTGVQNVNIDNIECDTSTFDIITMFHAVNVNISNISGTGITESVILIECQNAGAFISDVNINNVVSDSGKIFIGTSEATTYIKNINLNNINVPILTLENSSGTAGDVSNIYGKNIRINGGTPSRMLYIYNVSDTSLDINITGSPTISGVEVVKTDRIELTGSISVSSAVNVLVLSEARETTGKIRLLGGTNGIYLVGVVGTMGGVNLEIHASEQSDKAVDYDGNTSISHNVKIHGEYNNQPTNYGNVAGSIVELQEGSGQTLVLASDELAAVFNKLHIIQSQTGVTDNLQNIGSGILGQTVILTAADGHTITVKHATGGGNTRTKTASDRALGYTTPITLTYNGTHWSEV